MTSTDQAVVRREIVVNAPIAVAFATFVERFGECVLDVVGDDPMPKQSECEGIAE